MVKADDVKCTLCSAETCVALYTYTSTVSSDLTFNKGDVITIIKEDGEWWTGTKDGHTGTFPANYVKKLAPAPKVRHDDIQFTGIHASVFFTFACFHIFFHLLWGTAVRILLSSVDSSILTR